MPIYEYQCKDCCEDFERLMPITAKTAPDCPKCSSSNVRKKISRIASGKKDCGSCSSGSCHSCSTS